MSSSVEVPRRGARARKCLFGRPDPEELHQWLNENESRLTDAAASKWSFDFANDKPLDQPGPMVYEVISAAKVPTLYRPRGCRTKLRPCTTSVVEEEGKVEVEKEEGIPSEKRIPTVENADEGPLAWRTRSMPKRHGDSHSSSYCGVNEDGMEGSGGRNKKGPNLRQACITNYLPHRKRRSMENLATKGKSSRLSPFDAPRSPFRFVDEDTEGEKGPVTRGMTTRARSTKIL